jgi:hypothetical protein
MPKSPAFETPTRGRWRTHCLCTLPDTMRSNTRLRHLPTVGEAACNARHNFCDVRRSQIGRFGDAHTLQAGCSLGLVPEPWSWFSITTVREKLRVAATASLRGAVPCVLYGSGHTRCATPHIHRGVMNRARDALLIFAFDMISILLREVRQSQAW